jgi:two-component system sensor histidine kinase UhpB
VTAELSSPLLDEYGLEAAIREYIQRYQQRTGIAVELQFDGVAGQLQPEEQLALYRIAQEALTNVAKHAQASQVMIRLETIDQVGRLVIADNGVGFDPNAVRTPAEGHGLGLLSIRDRAESIGGTLRVESSPGQGTQMIVELKR